MAWISTLWGMPAREGQYWVYTGHTGGAAAVRDLRHWSPAVFVIDRTDGQWYDDSNEIYEDEDIRDWQNRLLQHAVSHWWPACAPLPPTVDPVIQSMMELVVAEQHAQRIVRAFGDVPFPIHVQSAYGLVRHRTVPLFATVGRGGGMTDE